MSTLFVLMYRNILPKERWAIVGTNGCGKSTLLKSITGTKPEFIMEGKVTVMPGVRLGYLEQTAVSPSRQELALHTLFSLSSSLTTRSS